MSARRRAVATLAVAGFATALPSAAHAGSRADYKQVFTTDRPGRSTGIDTTILYKHPDDPEAKPIAIRQEVFTFPVGTRFDESVVPDCTVSDEELRLQGPSACPAETWIGGGQGDTLMTGFPGAGETALTVNAFDYGASEQGARFRVLGGTEDPPIRSVAQGVRVGRTTTVDVPSSPGGPPDGQGALRKVHNVFPARSLGRRAYARTPRRCPSTGVWTFKLRATFADGAVERFVHRMPCRRKARKRS